MGREGGDERKVKDNFERLDRGIYMGYLSNESMRG